MAKAWIAILVFSLTAALAARAWAAADDEEALPEAESEQEFDLEGNIYQWIFNGSANETGARQQLQTRLTMVLHDVDRACGLTESQTQKLRLAGVADTERFFEQVTAILVKFREEKRDQNAMGLIWQEIQPLQQKLLKGLYADTSFLAKTLARTLSTEQLQKYRAVTDERRRFAHRASVEAALTGLEQSVALTHAQHEAVAQLLVEKLPPSIADGQYQMILVRYQMFMLSDKIKPLLDEDQRKLLDVKLAQAGNFEQLLIANGIIPADAAVGDAPAGKEATDQATPADEQNPADQADPPLKAEPAGNAKANAEQKVATPDAP